MFFRKKILLLQTPPRFAEAKLPLELGWDQNVHIQNCFPYVLLQLQNRGLGWDQLTNFLSAFLKQIPDFFRQIGGLN